MNLEADPPKPKIKQQIVLVHCLAAAPGAAMAAVVRFHQASLENQAFFFSSQPSVRERARAELLERFCPRSPVWRQSVAKQGLQLLQAAEKMASLLGSRANLFAGAR